MISASIVGGSGYVGGELLRLLLFHPQVELKQVVSRTQTHSFVFKRHPNLRSQTSLSFVGFDELEPCDVLFIAWPHGECMQHITRLTKLAPCLIDCSADFRLPDPEQYRIWYGTDHLAQDWLGEFVYGLPEINRARLKTAKYISGVGCNAAAAILALYPLIHNDVLSSAVPPIVDIKVGSSAGGATPREGSHHPVRSGAVRSYAPVNHRHTPEVMNALALPHVRMAVTAVELVRGILATAHVTLAEPVSEKEVWRMFRECYKDEPFVRIVKAQGGVFRAPEPKILAGTNYADVGFACLEGSTTLVSFCALDNLGKGAAGNAVQCMNIVWGLDERVGLEFPGLFPI